MSRTTLQRFWIFCLGVSLVSANSQTAPAGLGATGPNVDYGDKMHMYGQFIGDWEFDWIGYLPEGGKHTARGEWHLAWVLEGRAIQDTWITPPRAESARTHKRPEEYGSTIRFYDPKLDAWQVAWAGPLNGTLVTFTARQVGNEILQEGKTSKGLPMRWVFSDIKPQSFHWQSVVSENDGKTWKRREEMSVHRVDPKPENND